MLLNGVNDFSSRYPLNTHSDIQYYLINNKVKFWPTLNRLISCESMQSLSLFNPASRCLLALIEAQPEVVAQTELIKKGWGEDRQAHVSTNAFYQCIVTLRRMLKESGLEQDIIRTIPRRGLKIPKHVSIVLMEDESPSDYSNENVIFGESPGPDTQAKIHDIVEPQHVTEPDKRSDTIFSEKSEEKIQYIKAVNQAESTEAPPEKEKIPKFKRSRPTRKTTLVLLYFIATTFTSAFVLKKSFIDYKKHNLLSEYVQYKSSKGSCSFYFNKNSVVYTKHISFINDNNFDCTQLNNVFVSGYLHSQQFSVIQCQLTSGFSSQKYCISRYYSNHEKQ